MSVTTGSNTSALRPRIQRSRRPPGPAGGSLLGSLRRLRSDPLALFTESATEYGDLVGFRAVHRRVFLVVDGGLISRIEIGNRDNYVKGVSYDALRIPIGDALLTMNGAARRARRRTLLPLFTRRTLLDQVPAIGAAIERVARRWEERAADGAPIDVAGEMNTLAFDVAGRTLLGTELGGEMDELEPLIDEASGWVARRTRALVPLPHRLPTPANLRYRRAERNIRAFARRLIAGRQAARGADFLSRMIEAGERGGEALDDVALRDELIGLLMAGYQTTGAALAWCWYLLGTNPDVDERLAGEAAGVLCGRAPDAADLDSLVYATQVLDETMRLYPPGWAFTRTALERDELGGYEIPAGALLVVSPYANQRNPRFWPDPGRFDPDRFEPGAPPPGPYHYFPFGVGPNACIGKHLARIEASAAIAALAGRFRLELLSGPVRAEPAITLTPRDPIRARVHARR